MTIKRVVLLVGIVLLSLFFAGCAGPTEEEIETMWASSPHADAEARSFSRWNDETPPEIPQNCAKCHSTPGYLDFHGANGTVVGEVTNPAPIGTTVECDVCHSELTGDKTTSTMPSGVEIDNLGQSANCLECHQGRASGLSIREQLVELVVDDDRAMTELFLPRLHNNPAGPTQYGGQAHGGFEYAGRTYVNRYAHVPEFDSCIECHDAHTLQIDPEQCSACHLGVRTEEDLATIRTSNVDYDGDGDVQEGLAGEIETLQNRLTIGLRLYSDYTQGVPTIRYEDGQFLDTAGEPYGDWTPRMLKAAYNLQYSDMNAGHYAHNGHYIIQLLIDSLDDLGLSSSSMTRPE